LAVAKLRATSGATCGSHPDKTFREKYFSRDAKKNAAGFSEVIVGALCAR
jgi:hypothetical protein